MLRPTAILLRGNQRDRTWLMCFLSRVAAASMLRPGKLIRTRFSLLRNFTCERVVSLRTRSRICAHCMYVRVCFECGCVYVCVSTSADSVYVINNANGFRQHCRQIMHKHDCVNKMQKNCSIPRLRIAYLSWLAKTSRSALIMYTFTLASGTSSSSSWAEIKRRVETNR